MRTLLALVRTELPDAGIAAYDGESWRMTPAYVAIRTSLHKGPAAVVPADDFGESAVCAMTLCHPVLSPAENRDADQAGVPTVGVSVIISAH